MSMQDKAEYVAFTQFLPEAVPGKHTLVAHEESLVSLLPLQRLEWRDRDLLLGQVF